MRRLLFAIAIITISVPFIGTQARAARPGKPGIAVADRPGDRGGVLTVTIAASPDDGTGADSVTRYNVRRRDPSGTWQFVRTVTAKNLPEYSFDDGGLENNKRYRYKVRASDGTLVSLPAYDSGVPRDNIRPRPPRDPAAGDHPGDQGTAIDLTFVASRDDGDGARDVRNYRISRRPVGGILTEVGRVKATGAPSYLYVDTGLLPGTTYVYRIRSFDGRMYSPAAEAQGTTIDNVKPRPPAFLRVKDHPDDHGKALDLTWGRSPQDGEKANDVKQYHIFRDTEGAAAFTLVTKVEATGADTYEYKDGGLVPGTRYSYQVCAFDGANLSNPAVGSGRPIDNKAPRPPSAVSVKDVPDDNGHAVDVSFRGSGHDGSGPDDVESYEIQRKEAGGTFAFLRTVGASDSTTYRFTDTGLINNVYYAYRVRAFDGTNYSNPAFGGGRAYDNTPPRPPRRFSIAVAPNAAGAVDVSFDASKDDVVGHREVKRYEIYRKLAGTDWPASPVRTVTATAAASYLTRDTGLTLGRRYAYRACAVGLTGKSVFTSVPTIIAIDTRVPGPARSLTATDRPDDDGQAVILRWSRSLDDGVSSGIVKRYAVFRRLTSVFDTPITKVTSVPATRAASYTMVDASSGLMNLRSYTYWLVAITATGARSVNSNEAIAVPQDNIILAAPTNLVARDRSGDSGGVIELQWKRSTSEGGIGPPPPPPFSFNNDRGAQAAGIYEVFRRRAGTAWSSSPAFTVSTSVPGDPITALDVGRPNGVRFEYRVRFRVDTAISPFSNVAGTEAAADAGTASVAPAEASLAVAIADAPDSAAPGQPIRVRVAVTGEGLSQARLEWSVDGSDQWNKTSTVNGQDSYEASFTLIPGGVQPGAEVRLVATAEGADGQARSEEVSVSISD